MRYLNRRQLEAAAADEAAFLERVDVLGMLGDDIEITQPREEGERAGIDTNAGHDCGGTVREIPGVRRHGSENKVLAHQGATTGNSPVSGQVRTPDPYHLERLESSPREAASEHGTGDDPTRQNPYLAAARAKKVAALVAAMKRDNVDYAAACAMGSLGWIHWAHKAKVNIPSRETRAVVIAQLRAMEPEDGEAA
jgi:hypothetical protein